MMTEDAGHTRRETPTWDMDRERTHMEGLLCQRFNFFLVVFGIVVAGSTQARDPLAILSFGAVLAMLLWHPIARAQQKLDLSMGLLQERDPEHPTKELTRLCEEKYHSQWVWYLIPPLGGGSRRALVGYWIPGLCCLTLALGTVFALYRKLFE